MIETVQNSLHKETHDIFGQMPKIRNQISITLLTVFIPSIFLILIFSYCFTLFTCIDFDKGIFNCVMNDLMKSN